MWIWSSGNSELEFEKEERLLGGGQGLAGDEKVHGREDTQKRTLKNSISSSLQNSRHLGTTRSDQTQRLQSPDHIRRRGTASGRGPENRQVIPEGVRLADIALERVVPLDLVVGLTHVLVLLDRKADGFEGLETILDGEHLGDTVADFEAADDAEVFRVGRVILVGHDPFVASKDSAGFQDPVSLAIDTLKSRGMNGSLNGIAGVVRVIINGHVHEITLDEIRALVKPCRDGVASSTGDLVIVVVETGDMGAGEMTNLTGGSTNSTANVEDTVVRLDTHVGGKVVFVAGDSLVEGLARVESAKVK